MKLLGWLRHKSQEHSREPQKSITVGYNCFRLSAQSSTDDHETYSKSRSSFRYNQGSRRQLNEQCELSGAAEKIDDETIGDLLHGFLTIGTLGVEPKGNDPANPTFSSLLLKTTEGKKEVIDNGSSEKSSFTVSTATEAEAENDGEPALFPPQGCQLSSLVELPETKSIEKKEMTSPGVLSPKTEVKEEKFKETLGKKEMQTNQRQKSANHMIRKILKKLHACTNSSAASGIRDPTSKKGKLQKVTGLFHIKIYPENPVDRRGSNNGECAENSSLNRSCVERDQVHLDISNKIHSKEGTPSRQTSKAIRLKQKSSSSAESKEKWIRTDADYLVLEL